MRSLFNIYKLFIFSIFGLFTFEGSAKIQEVTFTFSITREIKSDTKLLKADQLGNVYVLDKGDRLSKYNSEGVLLSTLNYNYAGSISSIDVSNPMEIFIFYKELNMVVILDNNLAFRGKINLQDWGITQASCIARSYENGLWIFDSGDLQLKKFSREGKLLQSSGNALDIAGDAKLNPVFCRENGNRVLLGDTLNGLFLFDVFAGFIKKIPISAFKDIQLMETEILVLLEDEILLYQLKNSSRTNISIPFKGMKGAVKTANQSFIFYSSDRILFTNMAK
ncbi:MAG: hypothetical protein ACOVP1_07550 [Bacteroidia bacterium]